MDIAIRTLEERDLPEADRIFRLAFGTYLNLPDPLGFMGDAELVRPRWRAAPGAALGAYEGDRLLGSNFAASWGSFSFLGPLTVRPDCWDRGIAQKLLAATMRLFGRWGTRQEALFTFPHSPRHIGLYQKFGFWPQYLTAVMEKRVRRGATCEPWTSLGRLPEVEIGGCIAACRALTDALYPGLDLQGEIEAVQAQGLGDTVLIHDGAQLAGFAICHVGSGSEAGGGTAYVKFGAVHPGRAAAMDFDRLLEACEAFAAERGARQLVAGVNTARHEAYRAMLGHGFSTFLEGVAMQRNNRPGFNRPDCFVMDDWR